MVSVEEALNLVLSHRRDFGTEETDLLQSTGRVLAQQVKADRDFPPYHRVTMDGIAINIAGAGKTLSFPIEKIQAAGQPAEQLEQAGNCIEVMTGAVLPGNTDAVIPYEDCEIEDGTARVRPGGFSALQNVHLQGKDARAGEVLLEAGKKITPSMTGVMAAVGLARVRVSRTPEIAVCSTGDELVPVTQTPEIHQIRRSNSYLLASALGTAGIQPGIFHLPDQPAAMKEQIASMKDNFDVLLFSGAVSKGKYDHLPGVLEELGMQKVFHRVAQKPGKPLLFGTFGNSGHPGASGLVFGFPGNPASTYICYRIFFQAWLDQCLGMVSGKQTASLAEDITFKPRLTRHLLVNLTQKQGVLTAVPLSSSGSGDLPALARADAIISLPPGREIFCKGEFFDITLL